MLASQFKYALIDAVLLRVHYVYDNPEQIKHKILNTEINLTEEEVCDLWDEYIDIENEEGDPGESFKKFVEKIWN